MKISLVKYNSLDILKFMCAILVTILHIKPFEGHEPFSFYMTNCYTRIAVPTFFIISGFLLNNNLNFNKMCNQLRRIVVLYICWGILYLPQAIIDMHNNIKYSGFGLLLKALILIRRTLFIGLWTPLWFYLALIYAIPLVFFMTRFIKKKLLIYIYILIYMLFSLYDNCYVAFRNIVPMHNIVFSFLDKIYIVGNIFTGIAFACLFLLIGMIISEEKNKINYRFHYFVAIIISLILLTIETSILHRNGINDMSMMLMLIPACYYIVKFSLCFDLKNCFVYSYIRKMSILIYGFHGIIAFYLFVSVNVNINLYKKWNILMYKIFTHPCWKREVVSL